MNVESVVEKILSDAKAEADNLRRQADDALQQEEEKLQQYLAGYDKQTVILAQRAAEEEKSHLLASARMELAKNNLAEKGRILDEVFEKAKDRLMTLPDNEYLQLISRLLTEAVRTGDEEVIVDKNEKRIDQNFITQINQKLGPAYKKNLRLSQDKLPIGAGFILKRGKIKTNASAEILLNEARNSLQAELAKLLFT